MFRLLFTLPLLARLLLLDDPPDPSAPAADPPAPTPPGDRGYPDGTPVADMTVEQQVAYWRHHSRQHEERSKTARAEADQHKARVDELEAATATEQEKAVKAARDEARAEALREAAPRLVSAEFRAAAKGVLTDEQTVALLEDLDLSKYLTAKGEVDVERVAKKVAAFAPAKGTGNGNGHTPDLGQGHRDPAKTSAKETGLEEARKRFGERQPVGTPQK